MSNKNPIEPPVYSITEFCKAYGISKGTYYRWLVQNRLPKLMRVGGRVFITKESAKAWQKANDGHLN